jgi:tryptophan synthase alpha chain
MTHMICGYPNLTESKKIFTILSQYSKYVEIQFPFSDPIADGTTISEANTIALKKNITTKQCFDFVKKYTKKSEAQILIMTYYNIVFNY